MPGPLAHRPMGHLPLLDGLRGIAILLVFMVHLYAPVFSGGSSGVDLFFVLSGFLITKLALEERDRRGALSLSDFYLRRVFRILPALFVLVAAMLLASYTLLSDVGETLRREVLFASLSIGNLWALFYGTELRTALGHTWSLGLEEQFYLVWPVLLAGAIVSGVPTRRLAQVIVIATAASVFVGRVVVFGLLNYPHWESIPVFNFDGLAIGCLIAVFVHHDAAGRTRRLPRWPAAVAAVLVVADLFLARFYFAHDTFHVRTVVLRIAFGLILIVVVTGLGGKVAQPLRSRGLALAGLLSYSLYLWHVPVFYILSTERVPDFPRPVLVALRILVAVAAAVLSYRFIERPALEVGRVVRQRSARQPTQGTSPSRRTHRDEATWLP
jgi:peptidoglycan/LPS O-acetylase OafA/YrhL